MDPKGEAKSERAKALGVNGNVRAEMFSGSLQRRKLRGKPRVLYSGGSAFPACASTSTSAPAVSVSGGSSSASHMGQGPNAMGSLPCGALSPHVGQAPAMPQLPQGVLLRPLLLLSPPQRPPLPSALSPGLRLEPSAPGCSSAGSRLSALRCSCRHSAIPLTYGRRERAEGRAPRMANQSLQKPALRPIPCYCCSSYKDASAKQARFLGNGKTSLDRQITRGGGAKSPQEDRLPDRFPLWR